MKGTHWNVFHDPGTGTLLSQTMLDDKMPTTMDLDETKNNPVLLETISHTGPFGAHGIGEPAASANAVAYNIAVGNAIGQIIEERPIPPRRILQLLGKA
jgi:CO/xanthine dehydrogenase Mo-binding subunit